VEYYLYQDSFEDAYKKRYAGLSAVGWHREDYHILQVRGHSMQVGLSRAIDKRGRVTYLSFIRRFELDHRYCVPSCL
jgi:hypothetical protein